MANRYYPLLLIPHYCRQSWGGSLLSGHFGRDLSAYDGAIGEAYELIDDQVHSTLIDNGTLQGRSIQDLMQLGAAELVGSEYRSMRSFPLIVKYIDTGRKMPLQVYRETRVADDAATAGASIHLWYIITARSNAKIFAGIKATCTRQKFLQLARTPEIEELLQSFPSEPGDAYALPAGRVHAVGDGNLILSYQQNSDRPLMIHDWSADFEAQQSKRSDGDSADEDALNHIHFHDRTLARIRGESTTVPRNRKIPLVRTSPVIHLDELRLVESYHEYTNGATFNLLTAVDADVDVTADGVHVRVQRGRSCLIPAAAGAFSVDPLSAAVKVLKASLRMK